MGGKDVQGLKKFDEIVEGLDNCGMVAFACQECKKKFRYDRMLEIEQFMLQRGFVNCDTKNHLVGMYEMFLIIFVKAKLSKDVSKVNSTYLQKGFMGVVGNKGAIAYSFTLKNRLFNFIAVHLRHGQAKEAERN